MTKKSRQEFKYLENKFLIEVLQKCLEELIYLI